MEPGEVRAFVERTKDVIEDDPTMGVRNTQLRVIEPFLSLLGWDVRSAAVEAAYETPTGTVVDYALVPEDRPGAFVSVVGCETALSQEGRDDLVAAMRASNVRRGVFTNGREYLLLARGSTRSSAATEASRSNAESVNGKASGDAESMEQVRVSIEELPEHVDALSVLSYDSIAALVGGDRRAAAAALVEADEAAVEAVTQSVVDIVDMDVTSDVEPLARRFLATLVEELGPPRTMEPGELSRRSAGTDTQQEEQDGPESTESPEREPSGGGATRGPPATGDKPERDDGRGAPTLTSRRDAASEYVVRFFDSGRSVGAVGNPNVDSALQQAVEYLLKERGLGRRLEFPYTPGSDEVAFLDREPEHPDGTSMEPVRNLGGLYLYTGQDVATKRDRVETLAERTGLRVMFSGDWP